MDETLPLPNMEPSGAARGTVISTRPDTGHARIASLLPPEVRMGTSSWSFPGWSGIVWAGSYSRSRLAREGLAAYARHPLLRAVGLDRTYYRPLSARELAVYRDAVGPDFRFIVKAHEHLTVTRFPNHVRFGSRAGTQNPRFLDPAYAVEAVIAPLLEGLGDRLGAIVFQFPPQSTAALGGAARVAERLHCFFDALPAGTRYAAEIRNADWLTPRYVAALQTAGAVHCASVHPRMPSVGEQVLIAGAAMEEMLICRWNLGHGLDYEAAKLRYAPFARLVAEDRPTRESLAALCTRQARRGLPAYVIVNNKAEGSAPLSVFALAARIAALSES